MRQAAEEAKAKGLRPIDCAEIREALQHSALDAIIVAADVWGVDTSRYKDKRKKKK